jgi:glyoxylase-like metal-dependent hydrolase (beta-lactamase superfamily II)
MPRIYRWVTPLHVRPELAVVAQLPRFGLTADDVQQVVISHFHADHVAGLRDFPKAELFASKDGYEDVAARTGWRALQRAFVPVLLPDDFARRVVLLPAFEGAALDALGPTCDLFGDGSAVLVSLPGHARGQLGLLARTDRGPIFFVADTCWLSAGFRENRPPHWITHLFIDDVRAMRATLGYLHAFANTHPDVAILPSHCPEAYEKYVAK